MLPSLKKPQVAYFLYPHIGFDKALIHVHLVAIKSLPGSLNASLSLVEKSPIPVNNCTNIVDTFVTISDKPIYRSRL